MIYVKFKTDKAKADEIKDFYHEEEVKDDKLPYSYLDFKRGPYDIKAYKNKKEIYTFVFTSLDENVIDEAKQFSSIVTITRYDENDKISKKQNMTTWEDINSQIGSDEVGVGDFFGPLVVVSSYVDANDIKFLEKYRIGDSKKMNDEYIYEIGGIVKARIKNYIIRISANKLSELYKNGLNIHKVMAKCHNLAHEGIIKKYNLDEKTMVYVDQFTDESDYRKLVGDDLIKNPIFFKTKGESYFPSVAVSSVIARYTFLKEWEIMENSFGMKIEKGANALVDKKYGLLCNKFGKIEVEKYVKKFFSNYTKKS